MTRFWIMALHGRKLVRLLPPSENFRGRAGDADAYAPTLFSVDLMLPDFGRTPELAGALVYEAILEPGDVLFIPEGWGHQTLNLEWSLMISSNYIDEHNAPLLLDSAFYSVVRSCAAASVFYAERNAGCTQCRVFSFLVLLPVCA